MPQENFARTVVVLAGPALGALTPIALVSALPGIAAHFGGAGDRSALAEAVMATPALMILVGAPVNGWLGGRYGAIPCLAVALIIYGLAGAAGLFVGSSWSLIVTRAIIGLATGAILALSSAMIADFYATDRREQLYGLSNFLAAIVCIFVTLAGGWLVDEFGWRAPFGFYLISLPVLLAVFAIPGTLARPAAVQETTHSRAQLYTEVGPLYLIVVAVAIGLFLPYVEGPFLLQSAGLGSAQVRAEIISIMLSMSALSSLSYGRISRRLGAESTLTLVGAGLGTGIFMVAIAHSISQLVGGFLLIGLASGMATPSLSSIILGRASKTFRNRAAGLMFSSIFLGQFATPVVLHLLQNVIGDQAALIVIGIGVGVATAAIKLPILAKR